MITVKQNRKGVISDFRCDFGSRIDNNVCTITSELVSEFDTRMCIPNLFEFAYMRWSLILLTIFFKYVITGFPQANICTHGSRKPNDVISLNYNKL